MTDRASRNEWRELEARRAPDGLAGDLVLDTVGLYCPVPIMKTAARISGLAAGQVIEVLSDDRVILIDMPAWCRSTGHAYLGFREEARQWRLFVRRK
ncbi:MAG TPA: sulfurtransferase TusA family protein [Patescibacteria group bacterium]|nr:sulfurtransferase TusA family protein [Patescibacteria group bacterium]